MGGGDGRCKCKRCVVPYAQSPDRFMDGFVCTNTDAKCASAYDSSSSYCSTSDFALPVLVAVSDSPQGAFKCETCGAVYEGDTLASATAALSQSVENGLEALNQRLPEDEGSEGDAKVLDGIMSSLKRNGEGLHPCHVAVYRTHGLVSGLCNDLQQQLRDLSLSAWSMYHSLMAGAQHNIVLTGLSVELMTRFLRVIVKLMNPAFANSSSSFSSSTSSSRVPGGEPSARDYAAWFTSVTGAIDVPGVVTLMYGAAHADVAKCHTLLKRGHKLAASASSKR
jgi:hypothetical protein